MKLTHNPNKVQSSTSIQQHIVNQEIFVIKVFCHYSSMPIIKNMKTSQMAQVHHLLVIFWILEDRYAILAKTIAEVISKYRRLVRLQQ